MRIVNAAQDDHATVILVGENGEVSDRASPFTNPVYS
jgi:hypothetical protein